MLVKGAIESNSIGNAHDSCPYYEFANNEFEMTATFPSIRSSQEAFGTQMKERLY